MPATANPYKEIYNDVRAKTSMEKVIQLLEGLNFRWVTDQFIEELQSVGKLDSAELPKGYQWLVLFQHHAQDPVNDRFDFNLMFGIKFIGPKEDKIFVIYRGRKKKVLLRPWDTEKNLNMKRKKIPLWFPEYMTIEERKKWRVIHRKVTNRKPIGPNEDKFYLRYLPEVKNIGAGYKH